MATLHPSPVLTSPFVATLDTERFVAAYDQFADRVYGLAVRLARGDARSSLDLSTRAWQYLWNEWAIDGRRDDPRGAASDDWFEERLTASVLQAWRGRARS